MQNLVIRNEQTADAGKIRALVTEAFLTAPHSDGTEADIVEQLRAAEALALSLVAVEGGALVGHIAASEVLIDGRPAWFGIAPVAVVPARQARGIGGMLVKATLDRLRGKGAEGAVLVGDPAYYGRFGFKAWSGLEVPGIPSEYVLALPFGAAPAAGRIVYHQAFGLEA